MISAGVNAIFQPLNFRKPVCEMVFKTIIHCLTHCLSVCFIQVLELHAAVGMLLDGGSKFRTHIFSSPDQKGLHGFVMTSINNLFM